MDILRKELNAIYASQMLGLEKLDGAERERRKRLAENMVTVSEGCAVITDAASDSAFLCTGALGVLLGIARTPREYHELTSGDEDAIYNRMHPEDLADKRMLEYEFFRLVDSRPPADKIRYKATCRIRIAGADSSYVTVDNSTQVISLSPAGKIWLILCCYELASESAVPGSINACIRDNLTGKLIQPPLGTQRRHILTPREKEILHLIKEGRLSKEIAAQLGISVNTVNRHRQNILDKLSVGNSIEALTAAAAMKLL